MNKKIEVSAEELVAFHTISDIGRDKDNFYATHEIMVCPKSLAEDILVNLQNSD